MRCSDVESSVVFWTNIRVTQDWDRLRTIMAPTLTVSQLLPLIGVRLLVRVADVTGWWTAD